MKGGVRKFGRAERGLLPEGRLAGPMPWVIAIMMFLTVLAAAAGMGLASAAARLDEQIGGRVTIQIVEANPARRAAQSQAAVAALGNLPGVVAVRAVPEEEINRLLVPWLGQGGIAEDIPVPALIDVDLTPEGHARLAELTRAVTAAAPAARVDDNGQWLAPLASLIGALKWLAAGLVLLMVGATAATVVLAARAVIARPELLVADEPTGNVDPEMAKRLLHLFDSLNKLGTTVVVATHDLHLISSIGSFEMLRLDRGTLLDPTGALRHPPRRAEA